MPQTRLPLSLSPFDGSPSIRDRSDWVRVRTLTRLRWIAVSGQLVTVLVAQWVFDLRLDLGLVLLVIYAAVITNLMALQLLPPNRRLNEAEFTGALAFDMVQLCSLLALSGGLNNPFALLVLAQVAISATALPSRKIIGLCSLAITLITLMLFFYAPLQTRTGDLLEIPELFRIGFWAALVVGITFEASYARRVTAEVAAMAEALSATQMALAREQKLTDLGGVVAAAAHELGTPLATIALVSQEMADEAVDADMRDDALLIRAQAERCREILRSMGQAGKQDIHIRIVPILGLIEDAAEPHLNRSKHVIIDTPDVSDPTEGHPSVARRPEMIHGLRNVIQNAVDFATTTVWIDVRWTTERITVQIADDGLGFPVEVLPHLGDPFQRHRRAPDNSTPRESYEGMGLGLFIAKTLLERSGAEITFANGRDKFGPALKEGERSGAVVTIVWPRDAVEITEDRAALGENPWTDDRV
ncbi:sensor histidine kinase RegB [Palleronia caenipelagi]|uniref:histidine kinase n=1 Tax=Palleronia caenipelagi TaxID=2489174 RepID=A0A547Q6K8_9RHOB|nr:ActS/PrrB/RegB family redox-sensitive histidine kinase [Palleronia caenipelagi]TRD22025.1 ActS/PrrB/RegB family redox-sensitive histidine kinase [Palleronia caenipelagi]